MSETEAAAFARDPLRHDLLHLRAWDERAKRPRLLVPALAAYEPVVRQLLRA